jgi:hypothetical protein
LMCPDGDQVECCIGTPLEGNLCSSQGGCRPP